MADWIFQGNPRHYDLDASVAAPSGLIAPLSLAKICSWPREATQDE